LLALATLARNVELATKSFPPALKIAPPFAEVP
jgi:hypothetical protein